MATKDDEKDSKRIDIDKNSVIEGFGDDWFNSTKASEGGGITRHPIGDYRYRIKDVFLQAATNKVKPHNMLVIEAETVHVYEGEESAIGMTQLAYYGTHKSPKYLQQRAKNLLMAVKVTGSFKPSALIGKEFDATQYLEKGAPQIDAESGAEKVYVNARFAFERPAGSSKSSKANYKALSAAALKHLDEQGEGDGGIGADVGEDTDTDNVEGAAATVPSTPAVTQKAASTPTASTGTTSTAGTTGTAWIDDATLAESMKKAVAHRRALIAMDDPKAADLRKELTGKRVNPDGPVDASLLPPGVKTAYDAFLAKQKESGDDMGDLGDLGDTDAAPAANGAATGKRTGKRGAATQPTA